MRVGLLWQGIVIGTALLVASCGGTPRLHSVAAAEGRALWVTGSEGHAEYWDGSAWHPRPYPRSRGAPSWAYDYGSPSAAQIVQVQHRTVLITRIGEFLEWTRTGWERLDVSVPSEPPSEFPQVDTVAVLPGDVIAIHVHADALLLGTLSDFLTNHYRRERMPSYLSPLTLLQDTLVGAGYEKDSVPAVYQRDGHGAWSVLARFPKARPLGDTVGALRLSNGKPLIVLHYAFVDPTGGTPADLAFSDLLTLPAAVAAQATAPSYEGRTYVSHVVPAEPGRALFLLGGPGRARYAELRQDRPLGWTCQTQSYGYLVGALPRPWGWQLVTQEREILEIPGPACSEVALAEKPVSVIAQ